MAGTVGGIFFKPLLLPSLVYAATSSVYTKFIEFRANYIAKKITGYGPEICSQNDHIKTMPVIRAVTSLLTGYPTHFESDLVAKFYPENKEREQHFNNIIAKHAPEGLGEYTKKLIQEYKDHIELEKQINQSGLGA